MTSKLTLSIDANIIAKAKLKAKQEGKSLSAMVEDYLAFSIEDLPKNNETEFTNKVNSLAGSLKVDIPKNTSYKKMLQNALDEQYIKRK